MSKNLRGRMSCLAVLVGLVSAQHGFAALLPVSPDQNRGPVSAGIQSEQDGANSAGSVVSTGDKGMDILLNSRIDPNAKPPASVASSVVTRPSVAASALPVEAGPVAAERDHVAATARQWVKSVLASDKSADMGGDVNGPQPSLPSENVRPFQGIASEPPAWVSWIRSAVAFIQENRVVVLWLSGASVVLLAVLVSRQRRQSGASHRPTRSRRRSQS